MASVAYDLFTDSDGTALASHTPSGGGTWTVLSGGFDIRSNCIRSTGANSLARHSAAAGSNGEHCITGIFKYTASAATALSICGRIKAAGTTFCLLTLNGASLFIDDVILSVVTNKRTATYALTVGHSYGYRSVITSTTVTIWLWDLATPDTITTFAPSTTSIAAAAGDQAGVFASAAAGTATGLHMEAWYHDDPATVTLTDMTLNTVYQGPHAGTAHAKLFTGTYTGTPDTVKARVTKETGGAEVTAWTALTPSGGNASGTASVAKAAAGDWYLAMLCAMNSQGIEIARSAGANRWAVGDQTVLVGNSNVTGTNSGTPYVSTNNNTVRRGNSGTTGRPANDPMMAETAGASPGPKCVDGLQTEIGGIVGLIGATRGLSPWRTVAGTWGGNTYTNSDCWSYRDAADLARTSWASCTTVYGKILFQIRNFIGNAAVGSLPSDFIPPKFWAWGGGEDDGGDGGMTTANWIAAVQSVRTNLISDGYMLSTSKITFSQMGKYTSGIGGVDAQFDKLRSAVLGLADNSTWFLTGSHIDKTRVDSVHIDLNAQETRQGPAMGRSLSFAAGIGARRHGPLISSYAFGADRTKIQVTIIHYGGTDFTPTSGITGFSVSDSGGVKTITGVVRLSATVIEITTSTACVGATAVQYLAGAEPTTTSLVLDNQASPMPMLASGVAVYVSEVGNGGDTNKSLYVGLGIRI